ncbi:hypothetical protein Tco_1307461 [Tanacetum coccineum]
MNIKFRGGLLGLKDFVMFLKSLLLNEDSNIVEWDNVQAMIDADYELAARLQAEEQRELTIEERSRLFMELIDKRKSILQDLEQKSREENH